jgi:hypothetical protein
MAVTAIDTVEQESRSKTTGRSITGDVMASLQLSAIGAGGGTAAPRRQAPPRPPFLG